MMNRPPLAPPVSDIARVQNPSGQTEGTPTEIGAMPPAGVCATPVVRGVDAQSVEGVAPKTSAQNTDPEAAPKAAEGTKMALQISSAVADAPKPPARPPAERRNSAVEAMQPSIDLPVKRPSKITARVVVGKTDAEIPSAAADTPTPPLPMGIPTKPEREASGAYAMQPITDSAAAPATDNEAAKPSPNPFLRALADLFGAQRSPSRQSTDTAAVGSTGWAVQLGAPRSEVEAKRDLKRINTKYGSALRGSTVGLRKVLINGETVYRLDVVGLSRNEAASLCSRVKGDGGSCSIVR
jgi:SPOR domain